MGKGTLLVVGAAGDVGRGIVAAALESGRKVVAAGRDSARLERLCALHASDRLGCVVGDITSEESATRLWDGAETVFGSVGDAVVSVNTPNLMQPLDAWCADGLAAVYAGNVLTHFTAAKVFLPRLPDDGMLIGIGGGTADFIFPGMVPVSMGQAALRMLYRGLAKERKGGAQLRELMIVSMVAGESNRAGAPTDWVTDSEVGRHVCAILDAPDRFPRPILHLRSREQAGQPETEA